MKNICFLCRVIFAISLLSVFSTQFYAQQDKVINSSFQPLIDDKSHVGIVVGVIDKNGQKIYSFGSSANANQKLDGDSVFEIGSITKVFTSILLADMAEQREINLTDPINLYLPSTIKVPQYEEKEITFLDLATHTSGLPEFPANVKPKDESNPLAEYTVAQLYSSLSSLKLKRNIGAEYEYSSMGMGLLGHVLSLKAGASYEDLIVNRICKPLDLPNTRIKLSPAMQARLIKGFDENGKPTANWDLPTLAGAGALRSSANDMLKFIAENLEPNKTPLAAAMLNAQLPRHRAKSQKNTMYVGLGWHILNFKGNEIIWHDGGTGGYTSVICFDKKHGIGLVALSNSAENDDKSVLPKLGLQTLIKIISN
ncbi:MAG: beta-lactamase family protein [Acidobacteriota bacterium]|nr:beta-lactamase family protein [Acidobacteriota bacterium]